ncbi:MAG: T9SS type A sorting domain-containing protein [Saprospiraceae bacterium]
MKIIFSLFIFLSTLCSLKSQWEPLGGPYGGNVYDLVQNEIYQFASTGNGLYRSDDNGKTWTRLLIGLGTSYASGKIAIRQNELVVFANSAISGESKNYLVKSDDNGNSWITIPRPDVASWANIEINPYGIYICENHLWVSSDEGQTWKYSSLSAGNGAELHRYNDQIYLCRYQSIFKSSVNADDWTEIKVAGMSNAIESFQFFDNIILLRDDYGKMFVSGDGGVIWKPSTKPSYWGSQEDFIEINDIFYGHRFDDILKSTDHGLTWDSSSTRTDLNKMITINDTIIAATYGQGILRSEDLGKSFKPYNTIINACSVNAIDLDQTYLWTGCSYNGVSRQLKSTNTWDTLLSTVLNVVYDFKLLDGRIFLLQDRYEIYRSDDEGISWAKVTPMSNDAEFLTLYTDGHQILAGAPSQPDITYLYKSDDYGTTWQPDTFRINDSLYWPSMFAKKGNVLFTADRYNIFRSVDSGLTWEILSGYTGEGWITDIKASDHLIFVMQEDEDDIPGGSTSISRDNGDTWELLDIADPMDYHIYGVQFETEVNHHLISTWGNEIYISLDQAVSWQHFDEGLLFIPIFEIIADDEYLYAATVGKGVWRRKISETNTTSIDQAMTQNEISIFPNPSNSSFTLHLNDALSGNANIIISDVNGRVILNSRVDLKPQLKIQAENLEPGFYLITLQTRNKIYTSKIIIQH